MGDEGQDGWSALAAEWSELWGAAAVPAQRALVAASGIEAGTRVLDVGCGSGEFLRLLTGLGAVASGIDPAPGMVAAARTAAPLADVRVGDAENLPWADASFDVVTAVNALQFAEDTVGALEEFARVTVDGGFVAIANWAEGALNDLDAIEAAVAEADGQSPEADGDEPQSDGDLRFAGGLEKALADAGFQLVTAGVVEVPWVAADDATLLRGVLLGEDASVVRDLASVVLTAAQPFRSGEGYRLVNRYRFAVGRIER
jgi:SAM-dependent methyltransferase